MTSILKVNNIQSSASNAAATIASDGAVTFPQAVTFSGAVTGAGKIIGYHQQAYTDSTIYSDADLDGGEVTLASPFDGTWNYTTVKTNSTLRFTLQIAPIRHQNTWTNHVIKIYYSTNGSGGSYTLFGVGCQWGYTASNSVNEHAYHQTSILSAISSGTQINVKVTVERSGGSAGGAAGFYPNRYSNDNSDITSGSEFVSNSFLEVMEIG